MVATASIKLSRLQSTTTAVSSNSILIVEDDPAVSEQLTRYLRQIGGFQIEHAGTLADAEHVLSDNPARFFCTVLDLDLPDARHAEIVDVARARGVPAIALMDTVDTSLRDSMLKKHLIDCVAKQSDHQIEHVAYLIGRLRENRAKKIMIVDPSDSHRAYLGTLFDRYFYHTFAATDGQHAAELLVEHPDTALVLTDINMPRMDGFELLAHFRQRYRREDLAIIGISDLATPGLSAKFLKAGGNDFLTKPFDVDEFYCRITQNTNMIGYVRQIHHTATRDFLTGVFNRRHLFETGETLHANARRGNLHIAAGLIDADHFKRINDTFGHQVGDEALKVIATTLQSAFRKTDVVARYGGEEFVCLAVIKELIDAKTVFERVRQELAAIRFEIDGHVIPITVSIGVTTTLGGNLEDMLKRADAAVYVAKSDGRNRVVVDD